MRDNHSDQHNSNSFFQDPFPTTDQWKKVHQLEKNQQNMSMNEDDFGIFQSKHELILNQIQQNITDHLNHSFDDTNLQDKPSNLDEGKDSNQIKTNKTKPFKALFDNKYQKNICGNIVKKVIKSILNVKNLKKVNKLCTKYQITYQNALKYYKQKGKQGLGINNLVQMIPHSNRDESGIKKIFLKYMIWYLRKQYTIEMIQFGKMQQKNIYIEDKNKYLLFIDNLSKYIKISDSNQVINDIFEN